LDLEVIKDRTAVYRTIMDNQVLMFLVSALQNRFMSASIVDTHCMPYLDGSK
jgi:hypothetical protein